MKKPKRTLARPLLLAAVGAVTLTVAGCDEVTGSGNLMALNCDMYPDECGINKDMSVNDLTPIPDLAKKD